MEGNKITIEDLLKNIQELNNIHIDIVKVVFDIDRHKVKLWVLDFLKKMKLKREASKLAKNSNFDPSQYSNKLSPFEEKFVASYRKKLFETKKMDTYRKSVSSAYQQAENIEKTLNAKNENNELKNKLNQINAQELEALKEQHKGIIQSKYIDRVKHHNALVRFKEEQGIDSAAHYPESKIYFWGLLFIILILESMANAYFYAKGSDLGLLGGILQAFLISIANVTLSFGVGLVSLRYMLHHKSKIKRFLGALSGIVLLASIGFLHLLTAHYRELLLANPDSTVQNVILQTWNHPFQITEIDSFILIVIGFFITALVVYKGYHYDDPYPGHGKRDRAYHNAQKAIERSRTLLSTEFEDKRKALLEQMNKLTVDSTQMPFVLELKALEESRSDFDNFVKRIQKTACEDIRFFRGAYNLKKSQDDTKFEEELNENLLKHINDTLITDAVTEIVETATIEKIRNMEGEISKLLGKIQDKINNAKSTFEDNANTIYSAYNEMMNKEEEFLKHAIKTLKSLEVNIHDNVTKDWKENNLETLIKRMEQNL